MKADENSPANMQPQTLSLPEVAAIMGIGRNAAYDAARRGEIPTLRFGKLLRVPRAWVAKKLDGAA